MRGIRFLKRAIRWLIAWIVYYSGFLELWSRVHARSGPIILAYHRVVEENGGKATRSLSGVEVSLDSFRKQIAYLTEKYDVVSLEEAVERINQGESVKNVAAVTFDDGWKDNYTNAYPVLLRHKVPATIFLVTDYIGTTRWFWPERVIHLLSRMEKRRIPVPEFMKEWVGPSLRYLPTSADAGEMDAFIDKLKYLSGEERESVIERLAALAEAPVTELEGERILLEWSEVEEMANHEISFGSHTETHPILTEIPLEAARREVANSKRMIERHLGRECEGFAYPNGDWNKPIRGLVADSEYSYACSLSETASTPGVDVYSLRRRVVHEGFAAGVDGKFSKCIFGVEIAGFFSSLRSMLHRR